MNLGYSEETVWYVKEFASMVKGKFDNILVLGIGGSALGGMAVTEAILKPYWNLLSKDEDYWFHTRLCAGSHVLLKIQDKEPDEDILFECCKLAKQYSSATQPSKVGVIYTKRKFIKKPPHAPLGYVIYKNEKEVLI